MGTIIGHGMAFKISTTVLGSTYTSVAGVESVDFGSDKVDALDATDVATAGTTRVYQPGLENPGDISVKMHLLPGDTSQAALYAAKGVLTNFEAVTAGTISTRQCSGIITSLDASIADDKLATLTCKIQISGPVVIS